MTRTPCPGRTNEFGSNSPTGRRSIASREGASIRFCVVEEDPAVVDVVGADVDEEEEEEEEEEEDTNVVEVLVVLDDVVLDDVVLDDVVLDDVVLDDVVLDDVVLDDVVLDVLDELVGTGATFENAIPVKVQPCVVCNDATADEADESYSSGSFPIEQPLNATPGWTFCCAQLTRVADQFAGEIGEHKTLPLALVNDVTFQFASDPSNCVLVNIPSIFVTDDVFQFATEPLKVDELLNM